MEETDNQQTIAADGANVTALINHAKRLLYTAIAILVVIAIFVFIQSKKTPGELPDFYLQQVNELKDELLTMKKQFYIDSVAADSIRNDIVSLKQDRAIIQNDVSSLHSQLKQYPGKYEKIPSYLNLSADSISRVFTEHFGH